MEIGALVGRAGGQRPWKTYAIAQKGSNSNQALFLRGERIHTHWFFPPVYPAYSKLILTFIAIGLLKETRAEGKGLGGPLVFSTGQSQPKKSG